MTDKTEATAIGDPTRYRELGWWRGETFADDLKRWARDSPGRLAVVSHFWETSQEPDVSLDEVRGVEVAKVIDEVRP